MRGHEQVLDQLLRDGRSASTGRPTSAVVVDGLADGVEVDSVVLEEPAILGSDRRMSHVRCDAALGNGPVRVRDGAIVNYILDEPLNLNTRDWRGNDVVGNQPERAEPEVSDGRGNQKSKGAADDAAPC